jgi:lysyl-tRNA synthetase, class II
MRSGRVHSVRTAGNKLLFIDLQQGTHRLQGVVDFARVRASIAETSDTAFKKALKNLSTLARKGDVFSIRGHPHRTSRGELSILCTELPTLLAPSLHQIPDSLDAETRAHNRHVEMLVDPTAIQTLKIRHTVTKSLTSFLDANGFTSVQTPILTSSAGGAVARPFETEATEFQGEKLQLRIAPELWLKRLIIGGMEKVYEFGPSFRNEGVDATHNPEFYICEFYEAYATLDDLMTKTENMLRKITEDVRDLRPSSGKGSKDDEVAVPDFQTPFKRIEFIPTLEEHLNQSLPDLASDSATDSLHQLFTTKNIPLPSNPTLPRLLDALSSHYLEPLSHSQPVFITHHPTILSPLSKTFVCPSTSQPISARAELFIQGREIANMYEEENSPFSQREKFIQQAKLKAEDGVGEGMELDESYLEALEWALPPTGGWGCGVDRLVMLFGVRERIGDVLPFGGLRNVVGMSRKMTGS